MLLMDAFLFKLLLNLRSGNIFAGETLRWLQQVIRVRNARRYSPLLPPRGSSFGADWVYLRPFCPNATRGDG